MLSGGLNFQRDSGLVDDPLCCGIQSGLFTFWNKKPLYPFNCIYLEKKYIIIFCSLELFIQCSLSASDYLQCRKSELPWSVYFYVWFVDFVYKSHIEIIVICPINMLLPELQSQKGTNKRWPSGGKEYFLVTVNNLYILCCSYFLLIM